MTQCISLISLKAQIDGYHTVFLVSASVVLTGAFLALFIGNMRLKKGAKCIWSEEKSPQSLTSTIPSGAEFW